MMAMDSGLAKTIGLAIVTAVLATFVALADIGANEAGGTVAPADSTHRDSTVTVRWLSDANVLSLLGVMNKSEVALANAELQAWHSDTVRAYATGIARSFADLQHSVDSVGGRLKLAPVVPAVQDSLVAALQPHVDTVNASHGPQMDRVFIQQSVAMQQYVANYVSQLSSVAQDPEMQALVDDAQERVASQLASAKQVQAMFAVADSIRADSIAQKTAARQGHKAKGTQ